MARRDLFPFQLSSLFHDFFSAANWEHIPKFRGTEVATHVEGLSLWTIFNHPSTLLLVTDLFSRKSIEKDLFWDRLQNRSGKPNSPRCCWTTNPNFVSHLSYCISGLECQDYGSSTSTEPLISFSSNLSCGTRPHFPAPHFPRAQGFQRNGTL